MADFVEGEDMTLKKNHPAGYNGITDGVIWQQLLLFFFPILFGTFFQQLYNTADAMIVGKFVGKEALSAVGGTTGTFDQPAGWLLRRNVFRRGCRCIPVLRGERRAAGTKIGPHGFCLASRRGDAFNHR